MKQNIAGLLCYLAGFITGIVFLIIEKENRFVRFHAIQSIAISVVLIVVSMVLSVSLMMIPFVGAFIGWLLNVASLILWIILMVKAYNGEAYKLPVVGDFAEKQAGLKTPA